MPEKDALKFGPARRAPAYWAGETYGRHKVQYPDVERLANGTVPSTRDKPARRIIRAALKRRFSRVERALRLPRAMMAQAVEIINTQHAQKSTSAKMRRARRLLAMELAIHRPVYVPSTPELRALRTQKRKDKRAGRGDAISQLVDSMAGERK
jgi:hypothetical protein